MSSVPAFLKQIPTDARNFVPVSSLAYWGGINALNPTTGVLTTATWAGAGGAGGVSGPSGGGTRYTSSINGPGAGKLRDMGRTYVSTGRVFRKVQLVVPNTQQTSTFGVEGANPSNPAGADYLTGYIELGWEGAGSPAPVARAP
jgi:hypothetical protein